MGLALGVTSCVVDVDPRRAPSERETISARSLTVSSLALATKLAIGVAVDVSFALALVAAPAASERGVAGTISMRTATAAANADIVMDMNELSSRVPFLGRGIEDRTLCDHVRAHRATIAVNGYGRRS